MMKLKSCVRCGGDLYLEQGLGDDADFICLQCGKVHYVNAAPMIEPKRPGRRAPRFGAKTRAA